MFLSELHISESAMIDRIESAEMQVALMQLGVREGDTFSVSNIAPLGDPMAIHINGTKISIRRQDAKSIIVKKLP